MKILIIGGSYTWSIERYYINHLNSIKDVQAILYPAQNYFYDFLYKNFINKVINRLGLSNIYHDINNALLTFIEDFNPDIIWIFKGMEILPSTLLKARSRGIKLVNYNPDNPFLFSGRGSGNKNVTDSIRLFDLHFSYSHEIITRLNSYSSSYQVHFLPFGFELPSDLQIGQQPDKEIIKTCFIGNPDKERAAFLLKLLDSGVEVDLYGNNWKKFVVHNNAKTFPAIYGNDLFVCLQSYRIQLNMLRIHNVASHNMRTFEIPAVGGIQLAPYTKEHDEFFRHGEEVFLYHNVNDATHIINELRLKEKEEIIKIRKSAADKCRQSAYSYKDRSNFVLKIFSQI